MTGSEAVGWRTPGLQYRLLNAVKSSGAVSPATRASASRMPAAMPRARGDDHAHDRHPARRAQRERAVAQVRGDEPQKLLGRPQRHRDGHEAERDPPGERQKWPIGTTTSA